jgi:hypothetical protein
MTTSPAPNSRASHAFTLPDVARVIERLAQESAGEMPVQTRELLMDCAETIFKDIALRQAAPKTQPGVVALAGVDLTSVEQITYNPQSNTIILEMHVDGEKRYRGMSVERPGLVKLLGSDIALALLATDPQGDGKAHVLAGVQERLSPVMQTVFQITVLHGKPIDSSSMDDLAHGYNMGSFVDGGVVQVSQRRLSQGQAEIECAKVGSDASFFGAGDEVDSSRSVAGDQPRA